MVVILFNDFFFRIILKEHNVDQPKLELSFEYLLSKDRLQWITVDSPQVIFLSLCLQSMVEELMRKQQDGSSSCGFTQVFQIFHLQPACANIYNYHSVGG